MRGYVRLERGEAGALEDMKKAVELTERRDGRVLLGLASALASNREESAEDSGRGKETAYCG